MNDQQPLPAGTAWPAVARCVGSSAELLGRRRVHQPRAHVGRRLHFGDGTSSWVYRETVVDQSPPTAPAVLVVGFRLRGVRGRGHVLFRLESVLNTPLFVGFPGFVSKLWLAHDERGVYRGIYQWDGAERAEAYARALWRVLALVSVRGSIGYHVLPGLDRDDVLDEPELAGSSSGRDWWRPAEAWSPVG
jgi:hypothetical protein